MDILVIDVSAMIDTSAIETEMGKAAALFQQLAMILCSLTATTSSITGLCDPTFSSSSILASDPGIHSAPFIRTIIADTSLSTRAGTGPMITII